MSNESSVQYFLPLIILRVITFYCRVNIFRCELSCTHWVVGFLGFFLYYFNCMWTHVNVTPVNIASLFLFYFLQSLSPGQPPAPSLISHTHIHTHKSLAIATHLNSRRSSQRRPRPSFVVSLPMWENTFSNNMYIIITIFQCKHATNASMNQTSPGFYHMLPQEGTVLTRFIIWWITNSHNY